MYLIVLLPNYKRKYDHINMIENKIRALYRELVLFLHSIKKFATYQRMRANIPSWDGTRQYLCFVVQIFAELGTTDPYLSTMVSLELSLRQHLSACALQDLPLFFIPPTINPNIIFLNSNSQTGTPRQHAIADLAWISFFFLL